MPEHRARVAAIDCGTNSIRLLISDIGDDHKTDLLREMRIVRLGQDVDRTRHLNAEAVERTLEATREYAGLIDMFGVTDVRFCATSAVRDASNGDVFVRGVEERLGLGPDILTGEQEAALAFDGAVRNLTGAAPEPVLVVDIGGGSLRGPR